MRILVTGKNGQLGRSLQKIVVKAKHTYKFVFIGKEDLDLSNKISVSKYFDNNTFDIILNCAAYTAVDRVEEDNVLPNKVNHLAVKQLAQIAKKQLAKLIHISTDYVFDGKSNKLYVETDITNPVNKYGKTKLAGERSLQRCMPTDAIIIRTSWLYSEFGKNFIKTMLKLGKEKKELNVVNDQVGSPTYATDLAEAIFKIINNKFFKANMLPTEIYHYSNKGEISWYEFATEALKIAGVDCKVNPITTEQYPTLAKRPKDTSMNKDKLSKRWNVDTLDWRKSLKTCIKVLNKS